MVSDCHVRHSGSILTMAMLLLAGTPLLPACSDDTTAPADAAAVPDRPAAPDTSTDTISPDSGGPPSPDGGPVTTMAELCQRQAAIVCGPVVGCCKGVAPTAADLTTCKAALEKICLKQGSKQAQALKLGQAVIDAQRLAACEAAGKAASKACRVATEPAEIETCSGVILSVAKVGGQCATGLSGGRCAGGKGICFAEPTGTPCKAWAQQGALCSTAPCAPGLICMQDPVPTKQAICDKPRAAGKPCVADRHCAAGLACFNKTCATALAKGAACKDSSGKCQPGLMCDPLTSTCAPQRSKGGACYIGSHCAKGLACTDVTTGLVCIPGSPSDGGDQPGLPTLGQKCTTLCTKGLKCTTGPVPGSCLPSLCVATLQALK